MAGRVRAALSSPPWSLGAPIAAVALLAALVAGWLLQTPTLLLREELKHLQFWWLEACFAMLVAFGGACLLHLLRTIGTQQVTRLALIAAAALVLVTVLPPRTNRIYYDEQIYQGIGQNLANLRLAQMCNDGTVEYGRLQCWSGEYNKQPYAYPHLLSVVYRVFGVDARWAHAVNAVAMAATACAIYLLVLLLFGDPTAAAFASLVFILIPQQLLWSATASAEPTASLACLGALLAAAYFRHSGRTVALIAFAASIVYAVQFRIECLVIVPIVAVLLWRDVRAELRRPRFWWVGVLALALVAVHVAHMVAVRQEGWGTTDAKLSLRYAAMNFRSNGWFYLGDERFPVLFSALALVGLLAHPFRRERDVVGLYFLCFFVVYLLFYAGSYDYGADVRFSVLTYPPLAVLGGLGLARIARFVHQRTPALPAGPLLAGVVIFHFTWYVPLVRATTEEAWAARADVRFAEAMAPALRGNSYVLTHNPGMFHVWGVNAGQMSTIVSNPAYLDHLVGRYSGGVYLHWNFWCNVADPVQQAFCRAALSVRPARRVRASVERNQLVAFYRYPSPQPPQ